MAIDEIPAKVGELLETIQHDMFERAKAHRDAHTYNAHSPVSYTHLNVPRGRPMKEYIEERAVQIANYIIDENATVRQTAKKFGISKSTVHKDVTDRLTHINPALAAQARVVLDLSLIHI